MRGLLHRVGGLRAVHHPHALLELLRRLGGLARAEQEFPMKFTSCEAESTSPAGVGDLLLLLDAADGVGPALLVHVDLGGPEPRLALLAVRPGLAQHLLQRGPGLVALAHQDLVVGDADVGAEEVAGRSGAPSGTRRSTPRTGPSASGARRTSRAGWDRPGAVRRTSGRSSPPRRSCPANAVGVARLVVGEGELRVDLDRPGELTDRTGVVLPAEGDEARSGRGMRGSEGTLRQLSPGAAPAPRDATWPRPRRRG